MGDYLNSSHFELNMYFYDLAVHGYDSHITRKKNGVNNPFRKLFLRNGNSVCLRQLIEDAVAKVGCKSLDVSPEQYETLQKVNLIYQFFTVEGNGYYIDIRWDVTGGLTICEVFPDEKYVRNEAVYYDGKYSNSHMSGICDTMINDDLETCKTDRGSGRRFVMVAEDYPAGETKARHDAYWAKTQKAWDEKIASQFVSPVGLDLKKKNVVIASSDTAIRLGYRRHLWTLLNELQANLKKQVAKSTHVLLVDTKRIESYDHFAERLWRLEKGDVENAAKTLRLPAEKAMDLNANGNDIKIVNLQEFLTVHGVDYAEIAK